MKTLIIDFETQDWFISNKYGGGWCYPDPTGEKFIIIGASISWEGKQLWVTDLTEIKRIVDQAECIVAHNMNYDGGILLRIGCDIFSKLLVDTMVLAKLYDNSLYDKVFDDEGESGTGYSLNELSKTFFNEEKSTDELGECAKKLGLVRSIKTNANKVAYAHMKTIYDHYQDTIIKYANQDVSLTKKLLQFLYPKISKELITQYSTLFKALLKSRQKGVRIDLDTTREAIALFSKSLKETQEKADLLVGKPINFNSPKQLADYFEQEKIPVYCFTEKGKPSFDEEAIADRNDHPIFQLIREFKADDKALNSFAQKFLDMQYNTLGIMSLERVKYGRLYPEITPLGAITGRFTHKFPNIAQLPARNPEAFKAIRSIIIPEPNESLYALDFSNQEGRLQIHFAAKHQAQGVSEIVNKFHLNPYTDLHQEVSEIMGVNRKEAKDINLGLSYGMGVAKTSGKLDFEKGEIKARVTEIEGTGLMVCQENIKGKVVFNLYSKYYEDRKLYPLKFDDLRLTDKEICTKLILTKELIQSYHKAAPYLKNIIDIVKGIGKKQGYLLSLGGRKLHIDRNKEYKGFNTIIQGSAYDQTVAALIKAYELGINAMFSVHDEIVFSGSEFDAVQMQEIMETAIQLLVPVKIGKKDCPFKAGKNWYEAK